MAVRGHDDPTMRGPSLNPGQSLTGVYVVYKIKDSAVNRNLYILIIFIQRQWLSPRGWPDGLRPFADCARLATVCTFQYSSAESNIHFLFKFFFFFLLCGIVEGD